MPTPKPYYFLALLLAICFSASAQQGISVRAEKQNIILGEPLKLLIQIEGEQAYEANIPDSLGHFEILRIEPVENKNRNGKIVTQQELLVTCFDSGQFRIPPIAISGHEGIVSAGFDIMVTPMAADSTQQYGDIKQIISLDAPEQLPYQIALAALLLLSGWMIWKLNQKRVVYQEAIPMATPHASAQSLLQQLQLLKEQWTNQQIISVDLGNKLMDISRKFFAGKGFYATSKTGEELIIASKSKLDADTWMGMAQAIRLCNALRFGKFEAATAEGLQGIDAVEKAIQPSVNSLVATSENNV
jgi:hypothetical protein